MANILLKDKQGVVQTYNDVTQIKIPSADGGYTTFSEGSGGSGGGATLSNTTVSVLPALTYHYCYYDETTAQVVYTQAQYVGTINVLQNSVVFVQDTNEIGWTNIGVMGSQDSSTIYNATCIGVIKIGTGEPTIVGTNPDL